MNGYSSHLPALILAMKNTNGLIIELGAGKGSTPTINNYCIENKREHFTFENDQSYYGLMSRIYPIIFTDNYFDSIDAIKKKIDLLFVDSAPGEQRKDIVSKYADKVNVFVIHDTDDIPYAGYDIQEVLKSFKYRLDFKDNPPQTTIVSNVINLNDWNELSD